MRISASCPGAPASSLWLPERRTSIDAVNASWIQPPVSAAGSPETDDRGLEGVVDPELPQSAFGRMKHWVTGKAGTDRRWSEAPEPRLRREAASERTTSKTPGN